MTRRIGYWILTLFLAINQLWAGLSDLLRLEPLYGILLRLGYPPHFSAVLGLWKLLAAAALLLPRRPLLKEWAYAGLFFDFSSAIVAHAAAGDGPASFAGPILSLAALVGSWWLRPSSRRLALSLAS